MFSALNTERPDPARLRLTRRNPLRREIGCLKRQQGFYKSELAGIDDKTFDRVIGLLVEWRQASKAKASGQTNDNKQAANSAVAGKIGKEPVKSREGFSEAAKRPIAAAVSGNDIDPEQSAANRKAANSNLAIPDDGSIPPFLRREAA